VLICARHAAEVEGTVSRLSEFGECRGFAADLASTDGVAAAVAAFTERSSGLDILVNSAGTTWAASIDDFPRSGFEKVLSLNLVAPFELSRRLLPLLRSAATTDHPARIINIASIDGLRPPARPTFSYSASKAGMIMLTRHMAKSLAADRITVNAIAPGLFSSKMTAFIFEDDHPAHEPIPPFPLGDRPGRPEDMVGAVLYFASRAGSHVTGITLPVAGGEASID
jgi:NAD(P)-dependent dehydrogenase (short-subunit alcohol dehydrogenase family)